MIGFLIICAVAVVLVVSLVEQAIARASLRTRISAARAHQGVGASGLFDIDLLKVRFEMERRRAERFGGSVCITLVHCAAKDFPPLAIDVASWCTFPAAAFELADPLFCVVTPGLERTEASGLAQEHALLLSGHGSTRIQTGSAAFPDDGSSLADLIAIAAGRAAELSVARHAASGVAA